MVYYRQLTTMMKKFVTCENSCGVMMWRWYGVVGCNTLVWCSVVVCGVVWWDVVCGVV